MVAVGRDPSAASLRARQAIAPVPCVIQRADRGDVAVVVVGVGGAADRGHRMGVRVARPSVRVRACIEWHDRAHKAIVPLRDRISRCLWGLTSAG
jgi:hypothetical protein